MPSVGRVLHQGLAADKPTADATLNQGWLYYETDTDSLRQSWNGTWTIINVTAGSGKIDEVVVGVGGQSTIEFTAIPGTFRALRLIGQGRVSAAAGYESVYCRFNGDSGANYDAQGGYAYGDGNSAQSFAVLGGTSLGVANFAGATAPADTADVFEAIIPNYAATVFHRNVHASGSSNQGAFATNYLTTWMAGWWRSTAAITDIVLYPASGDFVEGTTVTLYGLM